MEPVIELTTVPPYGTFHHLRGVVKNASPAEHRIVACIKVHGGWWVKPFWDAPLTSIRGDGTFTAEVVTGGNDEEATELVALLVPADYWPPQLSGVPALPESLLAKAVARAGVERSPV